MLYYFVFIQPQTDSVLIKQAIMSAFPGIGANLKEEGYTPDNIETALLRLEKGYTKLIELEGFDETDGMSVSRVLSNARSAMLQQTI